MNFCPNCGKNLVNGSCECGFNSDKTETAAEKVSVNNKNEALNVNDVKQIIIDAIRRPFETVTSAYKLNMKISMILVGMQAILFGIFIDIAMTMGVDKLSRGMLGGNVTSGGFIVKTFLATAAIYLLITFLMAGIIFLFIYVSNKDVIRFGNIFGITVYALILPTACNILGVLMAFIHAAMFVIMAIIALMLFILMTYEGISSLKVVSKNSIIYAIGFSISISIILKYYFVAKAISDIIMSSVKSAFGL